MRATSALLLLSALCASGAAQQQPLAHTPALQSYDDDDDGGVPPYREPLLALHRALVDVPSISGSEGRVALLLKEHLTKLHYTVSLQRVPADDAGTDPDARRPRYNVLAWPGADAPRTLDGRVLVTSHIDVVPPWLPYRLNGTLVPPSQPVDYAALHPATLVAGRGAVDAKGSVAAQVTATTALLAARAIAPADVALLFVVSEETSGAGMKHFSASLRSPGGLAPGDDGDAPVRLRAAVFGEPTENRLACGHKGIFLGGVAATGRAGHSGYPWLGKSATAVLVRALGRLLDADLGSSARFGETTVNVGVVEGGVAANVIAKDASARLAVRVAVGNRTTGAGIVKEGIERVLAGVDAEALRLEGAVGYGPVECACDVEGFDTMVANYGTDVPNLEGGHVSYLYGPGSILVAHGDDEALTVGELEEAVEGYKRLIKHAVDAHA